VLRRWRAQDAEALGRAVAQSIEHLRPWMAWIAEEPATLARQDRTAGEIGIECQWRIDRDQWFRRAASAPPAVTGR
jgi:hypothetical protein